MSDNEESPDGERTLKERIGGIGQVIIGEIETLAGIVNADPLAQAEGEFNVEVGTIREEIEEDLEENNHENRAD